MTRSRSSSTLGPMSPPLLLLLAIGLLLFPSVLRAQSMARSITDPRMWNALRYSLDERDKLLKRYDARTYDGAVFVIELVEVPKKEITAFRAYALTGRVLVEEYGSEEDIRNLFGEQLFACLRDCPYTFEPIDPKRIGRSTAPSGPSPAAALQGASQPDLVLGLDEILISPGGGETGIHLAQGDFTLGLPQHQGGFSRAGLRYGRTKLGVQIPFVANTASSAERKLDGAIGAYGETRLMFGALALEVTGLYQYNSDEAMVNYLDRSLSPSLRAAGALRVGWTLGLGTLGSAEFLLGGQALTLDYRRVAGTSLILRPVAGDPPSGSLSWIKLQAWARYRTPLLTSRSGFPFHRLEVDAGLAGTSLCASLTWSPFDWLGLRVQTVYVSNPDPWQNDLVILGTPIIRLSW